MDETSATQHQENGDTPKQIGSASLAAFLILGVANVLSLWFGSGNHSDKWQACWWLGLVAGQVGYLAIWAAAPCTTHRSRRLLLAYVATATIAYLFNLIILEGDLGYPLLFWLTLLAAALIPLLVWLWVRRRFFSSVIDERRGGTFRFRVGHLLIATTVAAITIAIVRSALSAAPSYVTEPFVLASYFQQAVTAVGARVFLTHSSRRQVALLLRISLFIGIALGGSFISDWITNNEFVASDLNWQAICSIQIAVYLVAIVLPQFDSRTAWRSG